MNMELKIVHKRPQVKTPKQITIAVFAPSASVVCPISQEEIVDSELEFLKGIYVDNKNESLRGIRLQCNHEFSAMHLLYHWARNRNVLCPVCRNGVSDAYLDIRKLPCHFKSAFTKKIRNERRKDAREKILEDQETAAMIAYEQMHQMIHAAQVLDSSELNWLRTHALNNVFVNIVRNITDELVCGYRLPCQVQVWNTTCLFNVKIVNPNHIRQIQNMESVKLIGSIGLISCELQFPPSEVMTISNNNQDELISFVTPRLKYTILKRTDYIFIQWTVPFEYFQEMAFQYEHRNTLTHHGLA